MIFGYHHGREPRDGGGLDRRRVIPMRRSFSLEYGLDGGWYVGRLKEVPGVFSQGKALEELEENIRDAYAALSEDSTEPPPEGDRTKEAGLEVGCGGSSFANAS